MRIARAVTVIVGTAVAAVAIALAARSPSGEREWAADMAILAEVEVDGDGEVELDRIRDWRYGPDSVLSRDYVDGVYDPSALERIWLYEQEFDGQGWIAHTFLVFEFDEGVDGPRFLGLSMEARREVGEPYSIVRGMFRGFEAALIWATEEDLVTRRIVYAGDPVLRYRLDVSPQVRRAVFVNMARETRALEAEPRWYNTVLYNCTSSLIRYANEAEPGAIPLHPSWVLTGRIDEFLERLGYLDPTATRTITAATYAAEGLR